METDSICATGLDEIKRSQIINHDSTFFTHCSVRTIVSHSLSLYWNQSFLLLKDERSSKFYSIDLHNDNSFPYETIQNIDTLYLKKVNSLHVPNVVLVFDIAEWGARSVIHNGHIVVIDYVKMEQIFEGNIYDIDEIIGQDGSTDSCIETMSCSYGLIKIEKSMNDDICGGDNLLEPGLYRLENGCFYKRDK
jgi:hypothetical protein